MARLKNTDYLMYFDINRYEAEMKKAIKKATIEIRQILFDNIIRNIETIPFKHNLVHLASGGITSDALRKKALLSTVSKEGHVRTHIKNFSSYYGNVVMKASVSAMKTNFEDSHVGWYYEIGTGEESDPMGYSKHGMTASLGDVNPYRLPQVGAPIVSRSYANGYWRDLGGNLRKTESRVGGVGGPKPPNISPETYAMMVDKFRKYIGEDVKAYYWFEKAVEETSEIVLKKYKEAVAGIDVFDPKLKIFHLNRKIIISDKYTVG